MKLPKSILFKAKPRDLSEETKTTDYIPKP